MTFDQIWEQLVRKQPKLDQDDSMVEFTADNLRWLLRQVYEQGEASVPRSPAAGSDSGNSFAEFFGGKYGRRRDG